MPFENDPLDTTHKHCGPALSDEEYAKAREMDIPYGILNLTTPTWSPGTRSFAIQCIRDCLANPERADERCDEFKKWWDANPEIHF